MTTKSGSDKKTNVEKKAVEKKDEIVKKKPQEENKEEDKQESSEIIPQEVLDAIPPEDRKHVLSVIKRSMFASITRESNPIFDKISSEHITSIIQNSDNQDQRDRRERWHERLINLLILVIVLAFVGLIVWLLKGDSDLLETILTFILSFAGGFGVGTFYKKKND